MCRWFRPVPCHAATVTGCSPVVTITLRATGATCACTPDVDVECCSDNTYIVDSLTVTCGRRVLAPAEIAGLIEFPGVGKPQDCLDEVYFFPCAGALGRRSGQGSRSAAATGQTYLFDGTVTAVCEDCPLEDPSLVSASRRGVLDDEAATATSEAWSGSVAEATPTATEAGVPPTSEALTTTTTPPDTEAPRPP